MPQIGPYKLPNRVALAPMAGVTDLPFRRLCARMGAGLVVAEMISSNPLLKHSQKTQWRSRHDAEIQPRSVQIAGADPASMAEAARYNAAKGAQIIDINMGCPAKKVCKRAAGSALLADEKLVAEILATVVASVNVPVTLKTRTGPEPTRRNGVTIARIAEDAGITALAVHGRTRACAFKGPVEYDTIADIVRATDFPVFANGDIDNAEKAAAVISHTGAAGIMIGRAAQGRPWLCGQIATALDTGVMPADPAPGRQLTILLEHVGELHNFYGEFMGLRIARKHVGWYLQNQVDYPAKKRRFNVLETAEDQLIFLQRLIEKNDYQTNIQKEIAA
ncbi:MAG: tRNA dihydrouridine synthase DusB [Pseudomonadota bacterium]